MNHLTLPKVSNQSTFANQTDLLKAVRMEWKQTTTAGLCLIHAIDSDVLSGFVLVCRVDGWVG